MYYNYFLDLFVLYINLKTLHQLTALKFNVSLAKLYTRMGTHCEDCQFLYI